MQQHSNNSLYVLLLILSVILISFNAGKKYCTNHNKRVEYRFIPKTQDEIENNPTDILKDYM